MSNKKIDYMVIGFVVFVILGLVTSIALGPIFEARAFNECTGGNATYFTALFTELRVENCSR